ncbi:MAG: response regulator transcription factor [Firmicutes bacterium]|nr:response regulator transcription factor [Bacillota bacterium]
MIFCVEDDNSIRDLMIYTLNSAGFEAKGFAEGESFFEALQDQKPDLIMLDVMLPGDDGITILKRLKVQSNTAHVPVIMATAKGTEFDKVIGLDMGADDYLTKPFGMMEMIARIKAVLRRSMPKEELNVLLAGTLELNLNEHTVTVSGKRVQLTLKEFEMLKLFMEHIGRVYTRDQLLSKIWGADYIGETRTVDVHIGTLRTKLEDCGDYIQTVRGVGYRMEVKP